MAPIKIIFANMCQGLLYEGTLNDKEVFSKYRPSAYAQIYKAQNPDIVCLNEAPFDDASGNSSFIEDFAKQLHAADFGVNVRDKSWLLEDKYYGNAIISKYPLHDFKVLKLPNPHLEIDRPDGSHWVMSDSYVQSAQFTHGGATIRLYNLHYFPFFLFGYNMNDERLRDCRLALVESLALDNEMPTIVTGDFNNADDNLENALPELFANDKLKSAIQFTDDQFDDRYIGGKYQIDHVLYTANHFRVVAGSLLKDPSDHGGLLVELVGA